MEVLEYLDPGFLNSGFQQENLTGIKEIRNTLNPVPVSS
jgi:hypothetical protein